MSDTTTHELEQLRDELAASEAANAQLQQDLDGMQLSVKALTQRYYNMLRAVKDPMYTTDTLSFTWDDFADADALRGMRRFADDVNLTRNGHPFYVNVGGE